MSGFGWLRSKFKKRIGVVTGFKADDRGSTAIEFAIVAIPFLGLLAAIFETAFVYFVTQNLSTAVEEAARSILTGQVQANTQITSAQQFRDTMICNPAAPMQRVLASFIDCSKVIVDVRPASSFATADTSNDFYTSAKGEYCTGGPGDIIIVRAVYPMPVFFNIIQEANSLISVNHTGQVQYRGAWTHMVMGVAAFRNEPFMNYSGPLSGC